MIPGTPTTTKLSYVTIEDTTAEKKPAINANDNSLLNIFIAVPEILGQIQFILFDPFEFVIRITDTVLHFRSHRFVGICKDEA